MVRLLSRWSCKDKTGFAAALTDDGRTQFNVSDSPRKHLRRQYSGVRRQECTVPVRYPGEGCGRWQAGRLAGAKQAQGGVASRLIDKRLGPGCLAHPAQHPSTQAEQPADRAGR